MLTAIKALFWALISLSVVTAFTRTPHEAMMLALLAHVILRGAKLWQRSAGDPSDQEKFR